jgi:hypothetical protein
VAFALPLENAVRDNLELATAVLSAEVVDARIEDRSEQQATLRVLKVWKGSIAENSSLSSVTFIGCCACGLDVRRGQKLLLFLTGQEPYFLSMCGFNGPLESRTDVIAVLEALAK